MFPESENSRSQGTVVAGDAKYLAANTAKCSSKYAINAR